MPKKLYVGNLSFKVNDEDLKQVFEEAGAVASARVIKERDTGRSKGFGFVEMQDDDGGSQAISNLDGKDVQGRPIRVSEAREQQPRTGGFKGNR